MYVHNFRAACFELHCARFHRGTQCGTLIPKSREALRPSSSCIYYVAAYGVDATWYGNLLRASFHQARVKSASSKPGVTAADESGTLWGYCYRKTTHSRIAIENSSFDLVYQRDHFSYIVLFRLTNYTSSIEIISFIVTILPIYPNPSVIK